MSETETAVKASSLIHKKGQSGIRGFFARFYAQRHLQAMALPGVIFMLVFCYIPMIFIVIAFKDYRIYYKWWNAPLVGMENFANFFTDMEFIMVLKNTLGIGFFGLLFSFPLSIVTALLLNELTNKFFKRTVQTISYLPHFISWAVLGGIIITALSGTGFVNTILVSLHIIKEPIIFLAEPEYFWTIAIITGIWKELGFSTILYLAAIAGIDIQLYESATMEGAGRFKKMWYITIPGIKFTTAILLVLSVGRILNTNFEQLLVLSNSVNRSASYVVDILVYRMGIQLGDYSYATAAGLSKSIVALILLIIADKVVKKLSGASFFG